MAGWTVVVARGLEAAMVPEAGAVKVDTVMTAGRN